jgi:ferritin-like metal-binding protein YciE
MAAKSLQELFVEELRDAYDGEIRLTKALPKMARAAEHPELQEAFTSHLRETEGQIERLEQVFRILGEKARGKKCDGLMGIIEEGNTAIEELDGAVLDAALIAGAQRAEHYEIAAYGTLAYFAGLLGNDRAKQLLGETLEEEKATDRKLNEIAKSRVNRDALISAGMEETRTRMSGGRSRSMAADRSEGRRSATASRSRKRGASSARRGRSASRRRSR